LAKPFSKNFRANKGKKKKKKKEEKKKKHIRSASR
jgi:hypothetical protein